MSWKFNPPPGWPPQPEGWVPPPGWAPDPSWPPAPPGWQFWLAAGAATGSATPGSGAPPPTSAPPVTSTPPITSTPPAVSTPPFVSSSPEFASQPPASGAPGPYPPAAPPHQPTPAGGRPWYTHWWTFVVLLVLLLIGGTIGYAGTRAVQTVIGEAETVAAGDQLSPTAPPVVPTMPPVPSLPPIEPPTGGEFSSACGEVAVIMITMMAAVLDESDDLDTYLDALVDSRRAAADELRGIDASDSQERAGLDALADELDDAADQITDNRRDLDAIDDTFEQVSQAYGDFNIAHC